MELVRHGNRQAQYIVIFVNRAEVLDESNQELERLLAPFLGSILLWMLFEGNDLVMIKSWQV
jgi:hypothetical protein